MIYLIDKNIGLFSGKAVVAMDLADSLIESGRQFELICHSLKLPEDKRDRFSKVKQLRLPYLPERNNYPDNLKGSIKYRLKKMQYQLDWRNLKKEFQKNQPELLILNGYARPVTDLLQRYSRSIKTIQIIHVSPTFVEQFQDFITVSGAIQLYRKSDAIVFVSDECRKEWMNYPGLEQTKSFYIPNCTKEDVAEKYLSTPKEETRASLNLDPDKFYLVNVASLQQRKGQDLLIEAAPRLKDITPNLEILLIGSASGEYADKLKAQAEKEKVDFIKFMGRKTNAMEYVYASDAFILTSRAEAFPLVLLESMILKTPVIASNVDGVPEMIKHEETGLLFESESTEELIERFKELYSSREDQQKYVEQASDKYWKSFSKEQFTKRYLELIEWVLDDKR